MVLELTLLDFLNGLFSLIFVSVCITVGIRISLRYFKYKQRAFYLIGLGWAGICCMWWPSAISFLLVLFTGNGLHPLIYISLGNIIIPFAIVLCLLGITDVMRKKYLRLFVGIFVFITIFFEIFLIYYIINDPSQIGVMVGLFDVTFSGFVRIYLIFGVIVLFFAFLFFIREFLKSKQSDIRIKGILLLISIIAYLIGSILDAAIVLTEVTLIITRSILILSSIMFDIGMLHEIHESEENKIESEEKIYKSEAFIKMVSKHKRESYTEEEILYHKEKRICLVCKGKISRRKKYVCPKCDILYCLRCSIALSTLENICWVCESPIDESKPIKISETTEEIIPDKKKLIKKK
jgi:hypothetical protein